MRDPASHLTYALEIFFFLQGKLKNTKSYASTGNRTRNNSLEGCYANHYTIDALVLFETISNISIASV